MRYNRLQGTLNSIVSNPNVATEYKEKAMQMRMALSTLPSIDDKALAKFEKELEKGFPPLPQALTANKDGKLDTQGANQAIAAQQPPRPGMFYSPSEQADIATMQQSRVQRALTDITLAADKERQRFMTDEQIRLQQGLREDETAYNKRANRLLIEANGGLDEYRKIAQQFPYKAKEIMGAVKLASEGMMAPDEFREAMSFRELADDEASYIEMVDTARKEKDTKMRRMLQAGVAYDKEGRPFFKEPFKNYDTFMKRFFPDAQPKEYEQLIPRNAFDYNMSILEGQIASGRLSVDSALSKIAYENARAMSEKATAGAFTNPYRETIDIHKSILREIADTNRGSMFFVLMSGMEAIKANSQLYNMIVDRIFQGDPQGAAQYKRLLKEAALSPSGRMSLERAYREVRDEVKGTTPKEEETGGKEAPKEEEPILPKDPAAVVRDAILGEQ